MAGKISDVPEKGSVRQSVTIPKALADEVSRFAAEKKLTMSRALVFLAQRGMEAEQEAQKILNRSYRRFLKERDPARKIEAGKDLLRSLLGPQAHA